jgi:hypothetical protein
VSAPVTKVGVNEISVNINSIINGNYRVYVANDKGVLSAASLNMVVVSMPRFYDRVAAQSWSRQFGSSEYDEVWSMAVDAAGNVYVAGTTDGDVGGSFYGGTSDVYVKKYDPSGSQVALTQIGTAGYDFNPYLAIDGAGNVYVAGSSAGVFAGNTNQGDFDGFVAKFNSSLVLQGTVKQFGTAESDVTYSIVVDGSDNVYVAGYTGGAFDGSTDSGGTDGFVAKFNSSLVLQGTVNQFGTAGFDLASSVAVDAVGNVYVAGWTGGAFDGSTNLGGTDGFVAKFNSSLVLQGTVNQFGTGGSDLTSSIVVDGSGNVYVAGHTYGAFADNTNQGFYDSFVAKFNSSLTQIAVKQFGTTGEDITYSIAVDGSGNVYVAGYTTGAFLGNTSQGGVDGFVAKFNSSLVLQGTVKQFGTSADDFAYSVAVDGLGNVYVAGLTYGELFGLSSGGADAFVLKEVA